MTGQKQPIVVTNKLGHSISYDLTCEVETALSEASIRRSEQSSILPVRPTNEEVILTVFWVDNFDTKVDRQSGGGAINTKHLMAFQERDGKTIDYRTTPVSRTRKRKFTSEENTTKPTFNLPISAEPPTLHSWNNNRFDLFDFNCSYFTWLYLRRHNWLDQALPNFSGWLLKRRESGKPHIVLEKTIETHLPPITTEVTEFQTISQYMNYLKILAEESNMPYVNITLDVGAAMNAFKFLWANTESNSHIFIHPSIKAIEVLLGEQRSNEKYTKTGFWLELLTKLHKYILNYPIKAIFLDHSDLPRANKTK